MSAVNIKIKGARATMRKLEKLKGAAQRKVVRPAVAAAITPLNKAIKAAVPGDHPEVKRSIGKVVRSYKNSGVIAGVVGPRVYTTKGFKDSEGDLLTSQRVAKIAAELELGTIDTPPRAFLRPTVAAKEKEIISILGKEINKNLKKAAKRG